MANGAQGWSAVAASVTAVAIMLVAGVWASPAAGSSPLDRVFFWSFVVFAVGLSELFVLLVVMAIRGHVDLTQVFRDKERVKTPHGASAWERTTLSLSRLQAFLWTLVVMTVFFHRAVRHPEAGIPTIPPEMLLAMGISGAVYLAGKHLSVQHATQELPDEGKGTSAPRAASRTGGDP
jgi:hypothetical protein